MDEQLSHPLRRKEDQRPRRFRKGLYILPSLFTAANVLLGYYAILQVIPGAVSYAVAHAMQVPVTVQQSWHFDNAAKAIGFAVLFDSPGEVDAVASRVAAAGHSVITEPYDAPWGQRYATVADPDGYRTDLFALLPT